MKRIITLLLFIIFQCSAYAVTDITKVSINEAVDIAQKNNLDVKATRINAKIEENNIKTSNRLQNPDIGVFYNFGKSGKGNPQQIGISQKIEIGKRASRKKYALSNLELANKNIEYFETDLRMDVREAYTNLLAAKSILTTMIEQQEILNNMVKTAKNRFQTGEVDEIDVLQAQLLLNQIITDVNAAKYDVTNALYEFNKVINSPECIYDTKEESFTEDYKPLLIPKPNSKLPTFEKISDSAINNRADVKIALEQINIAEKNLEVVLKQRIPDIEIAGGYGYQNKGQSEDNTFRHGAYASANIINIPILYKYTPEINNAKLQLEQAQLNYDSIKNKALNDLKKAYEKFIIAQLNLQNYNENLLVSSEDLIKYSRKSYQAGKTDLTTLIQMEESYRMVMVAYSNALADYYNTWNEFIREVNNEQFTIEPEEL